jgi:hypothetical protein
MRCDTQLVNLHELADCYVATGELLWVAAIGMSPMQQSISAWLSEPRLGDFILVRAVRSTTDPLNRVGIYTAVWTYLEPDDDEEPDTPYAEYFRDTIHQITTLDGRLYTWSDVHLMRLPTNAAEQREAEADVDRYRRLNAAPPRALV